MQMSILYLNFEYESKAQTYKLLNVQCNMEINMFLVCFSTHCCLVWLSYSLLFIHYIIFASIPGYQSMSLHMVDANDWQIEATSKFTSFSYTNCIRMHKEIALRSYFVLETTKLRNSTEGCQNIDLIAQDKIERKVICSLLPKHELRPKNQVESQATITLAILAKVLRTRTMLLSSYLSK